MNNIDDSLYGGQYLYIIVKRIIHLPESSNIRHQGVAPLREILECCNISQISHQPLGRPGRKLFYYKVASSSYKQCMTDNVRNQNEILHQVSARMVDEYNA